MELSENLKSSYANQYENSNTYQWRNTGAKYKAFNILDLSKKISFKNVLEVGAGEGSILEWLSKWNFSENLHAIEISESGIESIKGKHIPHLKEVLLFDGYQIPYPDNFFDLIICSHVLEHVEHERILLREISRVSKFQIFEVPIDFSFYVDKKLKHFLSYGHINIYTPGLFRFLLQSENYTVLDDITYFYDEEIFNLIYKHNRIGKAIQKLKNNFIKIIPYLSGIKPNSYAVLTKKSNDKLSIF